MGKRIKNIIKEIKMQKYISQLNINGKYEVARFNAVTKQ